MTSEIKPKPTDRFAELDIETLTRLAKILDVACEPPNFIGPLNPAERDVHALNYILGRRSVYDDVIRSIAAKKQQDAQQARRTQRKRR